MKNVFENQTEKSLLEINVDYVEISSKKETRFFIEENVVKKGKKRIQEFKIKLIKFLREIPAASSHAIHR